MKRFAVLSNHEFDENYSIAGGAPIVYREGSENFCEARGYLRRVCKAPDASAVPSGWDRLTESKLDAIPIPTLSLSYDALGNICSKNGNAYTYAGRAGCAGAQGLADKSAHAVTQAFGFAYAYDGNGLRRQWLTDAGQRLGQRG